MVISVWKMLAGVGVVLFAAGALVGLIPVSAGGSSCGSAFFGSDDAYVSDLAFGGSSAAACDDKRSTLRVPAIVLVVIGGGLAIVGAAKLSDEVARAKNDAGHDEGPAIREA